jgi:hypothetical protein
MRTIALGLLLFSPTSAFAAGWTATQVGSTGEGGGGGNQATLFYDGGRFRIDAGNKSYVLEFKTEKFLFIDHDQKKYASATLDEVIALQNQILETMKKSVAQLPELQRKIAEAQIAKLEKSAKSKARPDVKKTGKKETINGYACEVVTWVDDFGDNEACIAEKMPVDVKGFLTESAALSKRLAEKGASNATPTQALLHLPGFPVRTKRTEKMGPQQMISMTEIKDMKAYTSNAETFAAPKAYQKGTLQQIVAPGM